MNSLRSIFKSIDICWGAPCQPGAGGGVPEANFPRWANPSAAGGQDECNRGERASHCARADETGMERAPGTRSSHTVWRSDDRVKPRLRRAHVTLIALLGM